MRTLYLVVCLLLTAVCSVLCQDLATVCEPENVEKCNQNLRSLYSSQDGPVIVRNEAELTELCKHQQSAVYCINDFVNRCMAEPHRNIFNNMTMTVQDFISEFCREDSLTRKVYIRHLDCFNSRMDQAHQCTQRLHEWNKQVEKSRTPRDQTTRQACCRYESAMDCMGAVVRNGCPREAADLFDIMVKKATKQFFQIANCDHYNYVLAECSGALSTSSPPFFSVILGSSIVVIFSMFRKFL